MTPAEQRVVAELNRMGGNAAAVASALGTSESYVHRIKRVHWKPVDESLDRSLVPASPTALSAIKAVLPPNLDGVKDLRDATIKVIKDTLDLGLADLDSATKLLKVLLSYERALDQQIAPALSGLNIFQDNRQNNIQITNLVDELGKLSPDTLRAFSGVPEPEIIDVSPRPVEAG